VVARRRVPGFFASAVVLLAAGCAGSPAAAPTPTAPPSVTVVLAGSAFVPPDGTIVDGKPTLTIPVGTTVTWINQDPIDHTATEYQNGFPKPDARFDLALVPGASGSYTFSETGTVEVGCVPHPTMQMLVVVE
jgi:plastocyanin